MPALTGTSTPIILGDGITLTAPALAGAVEVRTPASGPGGRGPLPEAADPELRALLHTSGLEESVGLDVSVDAENLILPTGRGEADPATLEVPVPEDGRAAVLMIADDGGGVVTWHFPEKPAHAVARGDSLVFRIPPSRLAAPSTATEEQTTRGLGGWIRKKVLSVLTYPVKIVVGMVAEEVAKLWEQHAHPYGVKQLAVPVGTNPQWVPMNDASWRALSGKRVLLLVHGIFSTIESTFQGLASDTFNTLSQRYFAVIGFDHPTVYTDPIANVAEFLTLVPDDVTLDVDVLTHSRGGLVARILSGELAASAGPAEIAQVGQTISVGKIMFVGTPNNGTELVDPANLEHLVNRFSSLLRVLPPGPWTSTSVFLQSVLEIVKIIGMGIEGGLPGLVCMKPDSDLLTSLNGGATVAAAHYAISTNFEPRGSLLDLLKDGAIDLVFANDANDVAVPTVGVSTVPADPGFPVATDDSYTFPPGDVWHCSYFRQDETNKRALAWLTG